MQLEKELTMVEASELLSRQERFMAVTQAMNTLLIEKGVYTQEEFSRLYVMWAKNQQIKPESERIGRRDNV